MRPETELWLFAQGQIPGHISTQDQRQQPQGDTSSAFCSDCRVAILSLILHISTLPEPPLHPEAAPALEIAKQHEKEHPETGPDVRYDNSAGSFLRILLLPSVVTLGACHHGIVKILTDVGLLREELPGKDGQLNKFLFKIEDLPATKDLKDISEDLAWGTMREKDIAIVQARTNIPRQRRTLLSLKSLGVFEKSTDRAVSWTFLGLDGSLTTLHTEPEYRGKGIAKSVAAKIFRENATKLAIDEHGNAWAHADVYVGNNQSESVCRSLGGVASWKIFWVRLDLTRVGNIATSI
jgi:hypothetical protein